MGDIWLPGHPAFCTILIWAAALVGAEIARWVREPGASPSCEPRMPGMAPQRRGPVCRGRRMCMFPAERGADAAAPPSPSPASFRQLRLPRVVGMLAAGLLLANVPGQVVAAFPKRWGTQMRAAALATIFLRCGLELEFKVGGGRCMAAALIAQRCWRMQL
jgi:hypothetical protein